MDIVVLEKRAFEQLIDETRRLTQRVESLSRKCQDKQLQKWLTGEDVCAIRLLCVSGRTLQQYRSDGKLAYKRFGKMVWYRLSDIEAFAGITMRPLSQRNLIAIRRDCIEKNRDIMLHKED